MDSIAALENHLDRWNRWLLRRRALSWGWHGLNLGLTLGLVAGLPGILLSQLVLTEFLSRALLIAVPFGLVALSAGYVWPLPRRETARFLDTQFSLNDRTATAYELLTSDSLQLNPLTAYQRADTLTHLQPLKPGRLGRQATPWARLMLTALLAASVVSAPFLARNNFREAAEKAVLEKAIRAEAVGLQDLLVEIENDLEIPGEIRQELAESLETALSHLKQAENLEQAFAALDQAAGALQELADGSPAETGLESVGKQQDAGGFDTLEPFLAGLSQGDLESAAAALEGISPQPDDLYSSDLADELERIASAAAVTNHDLAAALSQAAKMLSSGDSEAARENLSAAAEVIRRAGLQAATAEITDELAAELRTSRDRLLSAGALSGQAPSSGGVAGGSQAADAGAGTQAIGSGAGTGAGDGVGDPSDQPGGETGSAPINQQNQPGDGGLADYERIYAPSLLNADAGPLLALPESGLTGDLVQGEAPGAEPGEEFSQVPYSEVFARYETVYRKAIESGQVPLHLRELVRLYFTSLSPE